MAAGLAVLHSCTLSAALHRGGGGRQHRAVLCSAPIELCTQLSPLSPSCCTEAQCWGVPSTCTQCCSATACLTHGYLGGGELPHSAPHGGLLTADPLSCPLLPLQAVAAVCGFVIVVLLCLICFFAQKTRSKIWRYGKANIYWDRAPVVQEGPNVEEWVRAGGAMGTFLLLPWAGRESETCVPPSCAHARSSSCLVCSRQRRTRSRCCSYRPQPWG